ncbi:DUF4169 family protein [Brevundimonas balnearis]|uniref:DUF4169 family protein n=1 Tax=Brevundimonas balnearis TaxID=1572858 RepID=A0ABV6QZH6_9CAUL
MGEIVNLNRARKTRARAADKSRAAANRAAFGRTRAEREAQVLKDELAARRLDGARRDDDDQA